MKLRLIVPALALGVAMAASVLWAQGKPGKPAGAPRAMPPKTAVRGGVADCPLVADLSALKLTPDQAKKVKVIQAKAQQAMKTHTTAMIAKQQAAMAALNANTPDAAKVKQLVTAANKEQLASRLALVDGIIALKAVLTKAQRAKLPDCAILAGTSGMGGHAGMPAGHPNLEGHPKLPQGHPKLAPATTGGGTCPAMGG